MANEMWKIFCEKVHFVNISSVCLNEDGFPNSKNFVQTASDSSVFKRRVAGPLITLFLCMCICASARVIYAFT